MVLRPIDKIPATAPCVIAPGPDARANGFRQRDSPVNLHGEYRVSKGFVPFGPVLKPFHSWRR
jgi:hypothetical protein